MGGKMINTKSLIILLTIFSTAILSPTFSEAINLIQEHNFGNVKVGSTQTAYVNISTNEPIWIYGYDFEPQNNCLDMTLVPPADIIFPYYLVINDEMTFKVVYSPSSSGDCSDTLKIFSGDFLAPPNEVFFTGIGDEQEPENPDPDNLSQLLLKKLQEIIDYTNENYAYQTFRSSERDTLPEKRLTAFNEMLDVTYVLVKNGHFEAAYNKLNSIYKRTDGKPKPDSNDFVPSEKAEHLALMLQELISIFDFQEKQSKPKKGL
jgi:hypothetical protein